MMRTLVLVFLVLVCILAASVAFAQWAELPQTGSPQQYLPDRTTIAGMSGLGPELKAELVDQKRNADRKQADIRAEVWGVDLVQPGSTTTPQVHQAYLSYVLDNNQPVRTDQTEHTFSNIPPGWHTVTVRLLSADGVEIGSNVVLTIRIPK